MRRPKVCHITTVHPSKDVRIFHKECRSLSEAGFDVTLLVNAPEEEERVEDGVRILPVNASYRSRFQRIFKVPKAVYRKALELDADLYHFHDPDFLPYAGKLAKKGRTVFYDVHEDVPRQVLAKFWIPKPLRKLVSKVFERYEDRTAGRLSGILTATETIEKRFKKRNPNTVSIRNYPILEQFEVPESEGEEGDRICYIGSITKVRGVGEIVEALPMTDARFDLGGDIEPPSFREELKAKAGWEQVNELGFIGREKVREVLKRASIGMVTLHPVINYVDALPVKMFEYMAAGVPVIASDFPILKAIVEEHDCGRCVDPLDPERIAEAVNELLQNPDKARRMGRNGREAVEEVYNWEKESERLISFYEGSWYGDGNSERMDQGTVSSSS